MQANMQAGDLIFVRPSADDWAGQLVARATGGPYCHVRVCISSMEVVEALGRGMTRGLITPAGAAEPDPADVAACGRTLAVDRRARALKWLLAQLNARYSWLDIVLDALLALLPQSLGARTPFLVAPHQYDCSELAARFLAHAAYKWLPDGMVDYPERTSPNDLARALGLLADGKQQEATA